MRFSKLVLLWLSNRQFSAGIWFLKNARLYVHFWWGFIKLVHIVVSQVKENQEGKKLLKPLFFCRNLVFEARPPKPVLLLGGEDKNTNSAYCCHRGPKNIFCRTTWRWCLKSGSFLHPQPPSLLILLLEPGSERKVLTKETWLSLVREWKSCKLQWEQFLPQPGSP